MTMNFRDYLDYQRGGLRDYLAKSHPVQHPGSRGGHPWWDGIEWRYDNPPNDSNNVPISLYEKRVRAWTRLNVHIYENTNGIPDITGLAIAASKWSNRQQNLEEIKKWVREEVYKIYPTLSRAQSRGKAQTKEIKVTNRHVPKGHGADSYETDEGEAYTIEARNGNNDEIGVLHYNSTAEDMHIRWIEVPEKYRRMGIGAALMEKLMSIAEEQGKDINTNDYTESGRALFRHLGLL